MDVIKGGYLGPPGTFSQQAAELFFREREVLIPLKSINNIFTALRLAEIDLAIIPIENSLEGSVNLSMDLLLEHKLVRIIGEVIVPIEHCLLVPPGTELSDIRELYSHPQAIGQCNKYVNQFLPGVRLNFTESTAQAAGLIKGSKDKAMIGSGRLSLTDNMNILAESIQDYQQNFTRFLVIGSAEKAGIYGNKYFTDQEYKTSIIFTPVVNRAGILYQILGEFAREQINLTRIESRPSKRQLGEYIFYLDFEGHAQQLQVNRALSGIKRQAKVFRNLGSYLKIKEQEGSKEYAEC